MVVVSSTLRVSEVTFIIRVAIQILAYGSLFLLAFIILASAPRLAPVETHDILNRIVGQSTYTMSSVKWLARRITKKNKDRLPTLALGFAIFLFLVYAIFVSVSDVGLLGLYVCEVPYASTFSFPASVSSDQDAINLIKTNLLTSPDPSTIRSLQCNAAKVEEIATNITESICQSWHNSTYGDPNGFKNLNSSDSDILMPKRLAHFQRNDGLYTNSFFRRIEGARTTTPVLVGGIAIEPHSHGVRMVPGVPQLSPLQRVVIPNTIAVEADVGCMSLGIEALKTSAGAGAGVASTRFFTNGTWRKYDGPEHLRAVLEQTVDEARALVRPLFNETALNAGGIINNFNTSTFSNAYTLYDAVSTYSLPDSQGGVQILGNCSERLHKQLGVVPPSVMDTGNTAAACNFLQISGSIINGTIYQGLSKSVCAASTQINLVDATVETDVNGTISISLNRLPSNLNIVEANMWTVGSLFNETAYFNLDGILRYTLSENATGPTSHYIFEEASLGSAGFFFHGLGSAGFALAQVGSRMINVYGDNANGAETVLGTLENDYYSGNFSTTRLTQWAGQMGTSWLLGSVGYNGWAARNSPQLTIASTGGKPATCFHPPYALALLPLFVAAFITVIWAIVILFRSSRSKISELKELYGGMAPYNSVVTPEPLLPGTLLLWEKEDQPHLEVVYHGGPAVEGQNGETLVAYMKNKSLN